MTNEELETIHNYQADFDSLLAKAESTGLRTDWNSAQALIDNLREEGFEHEADLLRKTYLRVQAEWMENEHEPMDAIDLADRSYPRE